MKPLIAAACIVIIMAGGWYGLSEWQEAERRKEVRDRLRQVLDEQKRIELLERQEECRGMIASWEAGDRSDLHLRYGKLADSVILNCEITLATPTN